jgi:hypothetical protein
MKIGDVKAAYGDHESAADCYKRGAAVLDQVIRV